MKIGIITFWDSEDNYGQLLQCFASQYYLQSIGHDAFLIRYKHEIIVQREHSFLCVLKKILNPSYCKAKLLLEIKQIRRRIINTWILNHNVERGFEEFRNKYIKSTDKILSADDLRENPPSCDILMCGSDQIWVYVPIDPIYFLQFGRKNQKRIALSASFGRKDFPLESQFELKEYLSSLDYVTVRERSGIDICKKIGGINAKLICDPTLLNTVNVYDKIAERINLNDNIFVYFLGHQSAVCLKKIVRLLKNRKTKICTSQGEVSTYPKIFPSIPQWLGYIRESAFVITNSFHGVVFCLLYNKQFAVIPLAKSGANDRIDTLLNELELSSRICFSIHQIKETMTCKIDYGIVNPKLDIIRQNGQILLSEMLKE